MSKPFSAAWTWPVVRHTFRMRTILACIRPADTRCPPDRRRRNSACRMWATFPWVVRSWSYKCEFSRLKCCVWMHSSQLCFFESRHGNVYVYIKRNNYKMINGSRWCWVSCERFLVVMRVLYFLFFFSIKMLKRIWFWQKIWIIALNVVTIVGFSIFRLLAFTPFLMVLK
jgi:hypothetical protein